jgi:diketogulonate reductase-like aldo/keto reductase
LAKTEEALKDHVSVNPQIIEQLVNNYSDHDYSPETGVCLFTGEILQAFIRFIGDPVVEVILFSGGEKDEHSYMVWKFFNEYVDIPSFDVQTQAFNTLKANGDVLDFGVSNFTPSQLSLLQSRLDFELVTNQIEFSPYEMKALDDGSLDQCQLLDIKPMLWSPLAGGRLFSSDDEKAVRLRAVLEQVGAEIGATAIDQVVYAWLLMHPSAPSVVLGTGNIERVKSAVEAKQLSMSREQWYRIWQGSTGHIVP